MNRIANSDRLMALCVLLLSLGGQSCEQSQPAGDKVLTPETVGAASLIKLEDIAPSFRDAASVAATALRATGEAPQEFFVEIEETPDAVVLHLWHKDAFLPENANVIGNPGGKCRDMYYDPEARTITKTLLWQ